MENEIEQLVKADLLAVTLFINLQYVLNQKDAPAGAGSLAPPFYSQVEYSLEPATIYITCINRYKKV